MGMGKKIKEQENSQLIHTVVILLDTVWVWQMFKVTFSPQYLYESLKALCEKTYLSVLRCVGIFLHV